MHWRVTFDPLSAARSCFSSCDTGPQLNHVAPQSVKAKVNRFAEKVGGASLKNELVVCRNASCSARIQKGKSWSVGGCHVRRKLHTEASRNTNVWTPLQKHATLNTLFRNTLGKPKSPLSKCHPSGIDYSNQSIVTGHFRHKILRSNPGSYFQNRDEFCLQ